MLAKIGADTAESERNFVENMQDTVHQDIGEVRRGEPHARRRLRGGGGGGGDGGRGAPEARGGPRGPRRGAAGGGSAKIKLKIESY